MTSLFRTLFFWALAIAMAAVAVANRAYVGLSFDPFNAAAPAIVLEVRQFWVIMGSALIGIVLGGWSSWLAQGPVRQALRDSEEKIKRLEREIEVQQAIIVKPSNAHARELKRV